MEDFYAIRHRTVKIPEEKPDYYLEVKFKSSSHALDKLIEAIRAPVEEEDVKMVNTLHQNWAKNYDELLETDGQYRLMMTEEEEANYHKKWYRERDLIFSTFKAEVEEWVLEREERNLSSVLRSWRVIQNMQSLPLNRES